MNKKIQSNKWENQILFVEIIFFYIPVVVEQIDWLKGALISCC